MSQHKWFYYQITGIATQGSADDNEWVDTFQVDYSDDGTTFKKYSDGKVFIANTDNNSVVKNEFEPPLKARYIRVKPDPDHGWITMKMEVYGCPL